ncbi:hypothetical protein FGE12_21475 [Aggregicoccus sp. 17bor-14]|uniref:hypothetical protein n=1 Tax=Myxococcaceae TaxID=31 RepID=UPI00129CD152|nr:MULTISPECIES: hypothetical protein [Myxococcaceae]MBF5044987.1 hypothetical protein [Simulacricoccus sp. 17bor-14]MRI90730.1 hypothetical protein [Aggregicoccus sp. 17bor-14]
MSAGTSRLRRLWAVSPALVGTGAAHLALLALFLLAGLFDGRLVTGQPVWLKPAKFAASIALYTVTLAWLLAHVEGHRRAVRAVGAVTAATLWVEILIIGGQAARGHASHFNTAHALDGALFSAMGVSILVAWLAGFGALALLMRQRFADRAFALALRAGLLLSLLGAGLGGLMTRPTAAQRAELARGQVPARMGAHAVGAADDAPGLPVAGWSTRGGDLRVPHFLGLHAMQLLPLLALLQLRRRPERERERLADLAAAALGYLGLVGVLTLQALRAEPLLAPGGLTLAQLAALAAVTLLAWGSGRAWARRAGSYQLWSARRSLRTSKGGSP